MSALQRAEKRSLEIFWMLDCFCVDAQIKNSTGAGNSDLYEILRLCPWNKRMRDWGSFDIQYIFIEST